MEDLSQGTPYELDLQEPDSQKQEQAEAEAMGMVKRQALNASYHNLANMPPDGFWTNLQVSPGSSQYLLAIYP